MNNEDIDPFAELQDSPEPQVEQQSANRFGSGSIRQALSRWWMMLIFGALGYAAALYYMSIVPTKNEAIAVLEVDIKQRQVMGEELETERLSPELVLATTASKLTSPAILAKVAESPEVQALQRVMPPEFSFKPRYWRSEQDLAFTPASQVETVDLVDKMSKSWVNISGRRNTSLIDVKVSHPDSESARVIADTILKVFLEEEESSKSGGASAVFQSIKKEAEDARVDLEEAQNSVQVYVAATKLSEQIQVARAELISLRQRYKSKHPKLVQFSTVYKDLNKRFRREILRASSTESEKAFWMKYKDRLQELDEKIIEEQDSTGEAADEWLAVAQNALSTRANLLNARIEQGQKLYDRLTERLTELNVADEESIDEYKIIQSAFIGLTEDSLRLIYLAGGSILGAVGGFGLAYLLGVIDYKIYDVRSVEEITGIGCMAAVPMHSTFLRKGKEWQPVLIKDKNSANAEAIRNLRASIVLLGQKHRHKMILVTSAIPGEGKTTVASELAASFAMNKERTLLVGLDLRKPRLEGMFPELKDRTGVTEVLAGQAELKDCVMLNHVENLYLLGSGGRCSNPSELLHEEELHDLFSRLAGNFDRIVIDSAPILPVSDTRVLAKFAQSIVMVVRARKAPVGAVLRSINLLKSAGKPPAGVVINGLKKSTGSGYYGYKGYGEYNGEYGYYGDE
ncbi:capsular exopolysaccharide family [Rubritalea squalenifaciens DSM 18772]|uniref:non-specific protein-tyrosine kinase n=1 Tax=Rubritalea squalenifaciens DSM 18772 TaxID=1123071 RepID=A0A1M6R008_9BACT|nr:polysaccharide biosynthesis tyrosine autokinase [Rubritalea squalenifaciens]SHK25657.1 capsular exopolysaccharide family [Rubritalea squalenifaciens DSM 18772]